MTPPDPQFTDPLTQASAALLAVKPIFWFASLVVGGTLFYAAMVNRVEAIEQDVYVLKVLACRQYPNDTLCEGTRR